MSPISEVYKEKKIKINYQLKKTHQKTKMKQNNNKQVYVAPAVEANVIRVENGFSMSLIQCDTDEYNTEVVTTLATYLM